ncbi:MAG: glutamate racemase [Anaerovoracaceae bacterium]
MDNRPRLFRFGPRRPFTSIPHLFESLPNERVIYFGDTARTPYGSKAVSTIRQYSFQIADFLVSKDVKMLVIACNTISATCLEDLRQRIPNIPIRHNKSGGRKIASICGRENRIGIIGTKATVYSGVYKERIKSLNTELKVFDRATPAFVPLIEEGIVENEIMDLTIHYYMDSFIAENSIDTLVLGCTHYPIIRSSIEKIYPKLRIVNPSYEIIGRIEKILKAEDILAGGDNDRENVFYASDLSENFSNMIQKILETEKSSLILKFKNLDL